MLNDNERGLKSNGQAALMGDVEAIKGDEEALKVMGRR